MQIKKITVGPVETKADAVVLGMFAEQSLPQAAAAVDKAAGGAITRLVDSGEFAGKRCDTVALRGLPGVAAGQVLLVGLGTIEGFDIGVAHRAAGAAAMALAGRPRDSVAFFLADGWTVAEGEAGLCGAIVGCQGQDLYRAEKNRHPFQKLLWSGGDAAAVHSGQILGDSVNLARRLVNSGPHEMYPASFADEAVKLGADCGFATEVWDQARLEAERCGSLLAVNQGSNREARLVMAHYQGADRKQPLLGIVGKGVTFDSGGLSLKPSDGMLTMKCDMAGAATMLAAMQAISWLKLPVNVLGLAGLVENMTGPAAMKLGDVLHARNGRTIEVHNTDAEGRLVLADVLDVAVRARRGEDRRPGNAHRGVRGGIGDRSGRIDDQRPAVVRHGGRGSAQRAASRCGNCRCIPRFTTS